MGLKAVQIGAGNIGRGFTGQLLSESGYDLVFVDVDDEIVRALNERRCYRIEIVGDNPEAVLVENVRAVHGSDKEAVANEILDASIVCTAVGVNALKHVAPAIALGIKLRADSGVIEPLNIVICENLLHASDVLRGYILSDLSAHYAGYVYQYVGFVESVVSRMVPVMSEEQRRQDPLLVIVEEYKCLPVDRRGFVGSIPKIVGFEPYDNFEAYVERKLYTHNLGHAAAAYLGYRRGHEFIYQAMGDVSVRAVVESALRETGRALIRRHGFTPEEHQAYIDDLLRRFSNVALGDQVARVARDPIRKLGREDRLIGSARLAFRYGITPKMVCLAAAAALTYDHPDDEEALRLQGLIRDRGLSHVFLTVCGIKPDSRVARLIERELEELQHGRWL